MDVADPLLLLGPFLFMNYLRIYDRIIVRAKFENRSKTESTYYEIHHIVPVCLGGTGTKRQWKYHTNLVLLTAKEHYICHLLLCKIFPENYKIKLAYTAMFWGLKRRGINPSSRNFEEVKKILSDNLKNKKKSKEWLDKMVATRKLNGSYVRSQDAVDRGKLTRLINNNLHNPKLIGNKNAQKKLIDSTTNIEYNSAKEYKLKNSISLYMFYKFLNRGIIKYI